MPSFLHEGLLLLFRNEPRLALELLARAFGVEIPRDAGTVRLHSTDLGDVQPTDRRADLVVIVGDRPIASVVVEAQLSVKPRKRFTWPAYLADLRAELECDVFLLVVAPDARVARWCAEPIAMGQPGWELQPFVLGPDLVPVIVDLGEAERMPELGVLSAIAHGDSPRALDIAKAALTAVAGLDEEVSRIYADLVVAALGAAARRALEEEMQSGKWEYQSDFARKYLALGKTEGRAEGKAEAILAVLEARGLAVSERVCAAVAACKDPVRLDDWVRRAASIGSADELVG